MGDHKMEACTDPGGIPIFRDIDLPGAYRGSEYHEASVSHSDLEHWFSPARMSRYRDDNAIDRYVWNSRVSKTFLEDIGHIEVLLRNFIDARLSIDSGMRRWWEADIYPRLGGFRVNARRTIERLERSGHTPYEDQIVAGLSLDNWRFLLTPRLEATIWKASSNQPTEACPTTLATDETSSRQTLNSCDSCATKPPIKNHSSAPPNPLNKR